MGPGISQEGRDGFRTSVLIAESDSALADLYRTTLESDGWEVEVVSDSASLMSRLRRAPPAVLLLNTMNDARPLTTAEQVRSIPGNDDLVLILLFDSFDHLDTQQLARLNVQAWLSKTRTTRETLSATITRLVGTGTRRPT